LEGRVIFEDKCEAWQQCNNTPLTKFLTEDKFEEYMLRWAFSGIEIITWWDEMEDLYGK
jgi:hypothetical protein